MDDVFVQGFTSEQSPATHVELFSGACLVFLCACSSVFDESMTRQITPNDHTRRVPERKTGATCNNSGKCSIDPLIVKQCPGCRLQKCLRWETAKKLFVFKLNSRHVKDGDFKFLGSLIIVTSACGGRISFLKCLMFQFSKFLPRGSVEMELGQVLSEHYWLSKQPGPLLY